MYVYVNKQIYTYIHEHIYIQGCFTQRIKFSLNVCYVNTYIMQPHRFNLINNVHERYYSEHIQYKYNVYMYILEMSWNIY